MANRETIDIGSTKRHVRRDDHPTG